MEPPRPAGVRTGARLEARLSSTLVLLLVATTPALAAAPLLPPFVVLPLDELPVGTAPAVEGPPVEVVVQDLEIEVQPGEDSRLELSLAFSVLDPGWVDLPVTGEGIALSSVTLDGRPVALTKVGSRLHLVRSLSTGRHQLRLRGTVDTPGASLQLPVAMAASTQLRTVSSGLDFEVQGGIPAGEARWDLLPSGMLQLGWAPERPPSPRARAVQVENAIALRVDEVGIEGRARIRYRVANEAVSTIALRFTGPVEEVEVKGRGVASHSLQGDRLLVQLSEPLEGELRLEIGWRARPPGPASSPAPIPLPEEGRGETWVTVVRGDDSLLVPEPGGGLEAVPTSRVPQAGRGLVPGEPLVAYKAEPGERPVMGIRRLEWKPVDAPPTLVDEARYTVVHSEHGGVWMRSTWQVRNDRNPYLSVRVPPGWTVMGLRVAGRTAEPVRAEDGRLLVPLEKSVETLDGLVAFPVELMLVGRIDLWEKRGWKALRTPAIDAPIAHARWEVRLPRGVKAKKVEGATVVDEWATGGPTLVIGRGVKLRETTADTSTEAISEGEALSQEYWNRAYEAYKQNRFDEAEALLGSSLQWNPENQAASSLQKNVEVLQGKARLDDDEQAAASRVRELARARTSNVELEQAKREEALEDAIRSGDAERAQAEAERLVEITETLAAVEQVEAVDQKARLDTYRQMAGGEGKESKKKDEAREKAAKAGVLGIVSGSSTIVTETDKRGEIDFEDIEITGELLQPDGNIVVDERGPAVFDGDVEGGVEGGVVGGVLGGVLGAAGEVVEEELPPEEPAVAERVVITKESIQLVPAGRDLQSVAETMPGAGPGGGGQDEANRGMVIDPDQPMAPRPIPAPPRAEPTPQQAAAPVTRAPMKDLDNIYDIDGQPEPEPEPVDEEEEYYDDMSGASTNESIVMMERRRGISLPRIGGRRPKPVEAPPETFPLASRQLEATFPLAEPAPPAFPLDDPPPPPAPWGLDVPTEITASTLSLSLPETGTGLLLEERLVPPDQPIQLDLKYRSRRPR